jgi:hypothetical protein
MNTKSLSLLFFILLLLAAFTAPAQAHNNGGWGRPINPCWHPYYGGGCYRGGVSVPLFTIAVNPPMPPPAPQQPALDQNPIPGGFVEGAYLHSPWSTEVIPLANIRHHGQIVYDAITGNPFRAP